MRQEAKNQLIRQAEQRALKKDMLILDAFEEVVHDRTNFELVLTAMGGHYKAQPPRRSTLRKWLPKRKDHPAYIPPCKRKKTELARELQTGKSISQLARDYGVSRKTIYNRLKKEKQK